MATIEIDHPHSMTPQQLRDAVEEIAQELQETLDFDYQWSEDEDEVTFERRGASGRLRLGDDDLRIELSLGAMLRPLKKQIEQRIRAHLEESLP